MTRRFPSPPGRAVLCAALLGLMPTVVFAQDGPAQAGAALWQDVDARGLAPEDGARAITPGRFRTLRLDTGALLALLDRAPREFTDAARAESVVLALPLPAGRLPALPHRGLADHGGRARGRVPRAAHLQGPGPRRPHRDGALRLDARRLPRDGAVGARHAVRRPAHRRATTRTTSPTTRRTTSGATSSTSAAASPVSSWARRTPASTRRTRASTAATSLPWHPAAPCRPTAWPWPRPASTRRSTAARWRRAMSAITTTMNRVNGVYERDLAVRMVLVANNSSIVYTNAGHRPVHEQQRQHHARAEPDEPHAA